MAPNVKILTLLQFFSSKAKISRAKHIRQIDMPNNQTSPTSAQIKRWLNSQILFAALGLIIVLLSGLSQYKAIQKLSHRRQTIPYQFYSEDYKEIKPFLRGIKTIGYYTDRDLAKNKIASARLAQAQLMLTPTVIDMNHWDYEFIIIECSTPPKALLKIKEFNAKPVLINPKGIVLARKIL